MDKKFCRNCDVNKSINEFHNDRTTKDGKRWCCKECVKKVYPRKDRKCVFCKEIKSLTNFENKDRTCNTCRRNKLKRRKSGRCC